MIICIYSTRKTLLIDFIHTENKTVNSLDTIEDVRITIIFIYEK